MLEFKNDSRDSQHNDNKKIKNPKYYHFRINNEILITRLRNS